MARVSMVMLCAMALLLTCKPFVVEGRNLVDDVKAMAIRVLCVPTTEALLLEHDGRHECVYELPNHDKAVGVGYNLDDDKDTRRSELGAVLADYDKVYKGEACLNTIQISALLALDTRRALNRAADSVKSLDDQCCDVQAVFGDIQHSGGQDVYEQNGFEEFIEAVSVKKWDKATDKLGSTRWCSGHKERCEDDQKIISQGCGKKSAAAAFIAQVTKRA